MSGCQGQERKSLPGKKSQMPAEVVQPLAYQEHRLRMYVLNISLGFKKG